jgi:hypothetical protein
MLLRSCCPLWRSLSAFTDARAALFIEIQAHFYVFMSLPATHIQAAAAPVNLDGEKRKSAQTL